MACHPSQVVGAPAWFATDRYDFDGVPDIEGVLSRKEQYIMVQKLLAERFRLKSITSRDSFPSASLTSARARSKIPK